MMCEDNAVQMIDTYDLIMAVDASSDCEIHSLWETLWTKLETWDEATMTDHEANGQQRPVIVAVTEDGWVMGNGHHRIIHNYVLGRDTMVYFSENGDYYVHGVSTEHYDEDGPDWLLTT